MQGPLRIAARFTKRACTTTGRLVAILVEGKDTPCPLPRYRMAGTIDGLLGSYRAGKASTRRGIERDRQRHKRGGKPGACPSKNQLLLPIFAHIHRVADPIF